MKIKNIYYNFIVGLVLCILICLSSLYSAMKFGILAWPTMFVTLMSYIMLSFRGRPDLKEVTIVHTFASSASMIAGAAAYTLPVIYLISGLKISFLKILLSSLLGVASGIYFSYHFKETFIENEDYNYPIGKASYITLKDIDNKQKKDFKIFFWVIFSSIFALLRDLFKIFPDNVVLKKNSINFPAVSIWLSLIPVAIGALLSPLVVALWVFSSLCYNYALFPLFKIRGANISAYHDSISFALIIGFGFGTLIRSILKFLRAKNSTKLKYKKENLISLIIFSSLYVISSSLILKLNVFASFVNLISVVLSVYLAARLTGESGINPMEVLGFISTITVALVTSLDLNQSVLILITVTFATALCGDIMNDFKSGFLIQASFKQQIKVEAIGSLIGAVLSVSVVAYIASKGIFSTSEFSIPQAQMLKQMIIHNNSNKIFLTIFLISLLLSAIFNTNTAIIGLGIYLPVSITFSVAIGSLLSLLVRKKENLIQSTASAFLCGEGITAMVISFINICLL